MKFLLILLLPLTSLAQDEKLMLNLDKTICYPGDTLWFAGFTKSDSASSTNLYVTILDSSIRKISSGKFLIHHQFALGQLIAPLQEGKYWLQAYTNASKSWPRSFVVRGRENRLPIRRQYLPSSVDNIIHLIGDTGSLIIEAPEGAEYSVSIQKGTAASFLQDSINDNSAAADSTLYSTDTSFLVFTGSVDAKYIGDNDYINITLENDSTLTAAKHRAFTDRERFLSSPPNGWKRRAKNPKNIEIPADSLQSLTYFLPIDSSRKVELTNLVFYGTAYLHYMFTADPSHKKDYKGLKLVPAKDRPFYPPFFKVDTIEVEPDSIPSFDNSFLPAFIKRKKIPYQERNNKLRQQYESPDFEGMNYRRADYDLIHTRDTGDGHMTISDWLIWQNPLFFRRAADGLLGFPGIYFLNEKWISREDFCNLPISRLSYVNYLLKGCADCDPNKLCAWTRQGIESRTASGQHFFAIVGYVSPLKWTGSDHNTLFWQPYINARYYRVKLYPTPFTMTIVGRQKDGTLFLYQNAFQ